MLLYWRGVVRKAYCRIGLRGLVEGAFAGLGVAIAIAGMEWSSVASHTPLVLIPFNEWVKRSRVVTSRLEILLQNLQVDHVTIECFNHFRELLLSIHRHADPHDFSGLKVSSISGSGTVIPSHPCQGAPGIQRPRSGPDRARVARGEPG